MKRKRVSKKNKTAWRKHVNIDDVEKFLEDQRLDERIGQFTEDDIFYETHASKEEPTSLSKKEKAKLKLLNPKSFMSLKSDSKVPDPIKKRNRVKTREERKSVMVKNRELRELKEGILKSKELRAQKDRKLYESKKENKPKRVEINKDVWNETTNDLEFDEWASKDTIKHNLAGVGKLQKRVHKTISTKNSLLPSVEPPHPGTSYNPSLADHQSLLNEIAELEQAVIKKEEHINRVTKGMFSKVTQNKKNSDWIEEMSEGLPISKGNTKNDEGNETGDGDDGEYRSVNPPVINKKKTPQQRRKQREQLQQQLMRKAIKLEKKKVTDIHKIKILNKIIEKEKKKNLLMQQKREKSKETKKYDVKRLGSNKYEEPCKDFNLGSELTGNLKNMKKDGSLLVDRFKSFQRRNLLEPTKVHCKKRAQVKKYIRPGHRDEDWKKTVARRISN